MSNALLIQGIGFAAVAISLCIFQTNKRMNMLKLGTASGLLYAAHFYLLGAFTGSAMNLIGSARSYAYFKIEPSPKTQIVLYGFIALIVLATMMTWAGPISLLPMFGLISGSIAFWQSNPTLIRRLALIASPLWFIYNYKVGSYPGMFIETVMLTSNLVGQYRFDFQKRVTKPFQPSDQLAQ